MARIDLLKANLILSILAAAIGAAIPVAFSFLLLYLDFGFGRQPQLIVLWKPPLIRKALLRRSSLEPL
jgi:hypothetical protein